MVRSENKNTILLNFSKFALIQTKTSHEHATMPWLKEQYRHDQSTLSRGHGIGVLV